MDDKITISRSHYEELQDAYWFLNALCNAGVDNWDGYSKTVSDHYGKDDEVLDDKKDGD